MEGRIVVDGEEVVEDERKDGGWWRKDSGRWREGG